MAADDNIDHDPVHAMHQRFEDDKQDSRALLDLIQEQNRKDLDNSDFTTHFIDALKDVDDLDPHARIFVSRRRGFEKNLTTIYAVLSQGSGDNIVQHKRTVGEDLGGSIMSTKPFDEDDLLLAIKQLDGLQVLKDIGVIALDHSLSEVTDMTGTIRRGF